MLKGIVTPFGGRVESRLIQSVLISWSTSHHFYHILRGHYPKIQKTVWGILIIFSMTLIVQSHFKRIFDSVRWFYWIASNPCYDNTRMHLPCSLTWFKKSSVSTECSDLTKSMWFLKSSWLINVIASSDPIFADFFNCVHFGAFFA